MTASILFSEMTPDPAWEGEFNDWYNTEHIPLRMGAPGFQSARRYRQTDGPSYLAVYEMDDLAALQTEAYTAIKTKPSAQTARMLREVSGFTRYLGRPTTTVTRPDLTVEAMIEGPVLYAVFFAAPPDRIADFDYWYDEDHVPILMECPEWRGVRRFVITDGHPEAWTHLAIHSIDSLAALDSDARKRARATPVRAKLAAEPWFHAHYRTFDLIRSFSKADAIAGA